MTNIERQLRYSTEHEWVNFDASTGIASVGITDYAQGSLGDIVFVEEPKLTAVKAGEVVSSVESVKTTSDIYAPVSGEIVEFNRDLSTSPESLNSSPYQAWIFKIKLSNQEELAKLLDFDAYQASL